MNAKQLVSSNVKKIRAQKDISQDKLAKASGLDKKYISRLENKPQNITLDVLERLAIGLRCDIKDLLKTNKSKNAKPSKANLVDTALSALRELKKELE